MARRLSLASEEVRRLNSASYYWLKASRVGRARERVSQAQAILKRIASPKLTSKADYQLALVLQESGDLLGAARTYERALGPDYMLSTLDRVAPRLQLAEVRAKLGQYDRAFAALHQVQKMDLSSLSEAYQAQISSNIGAILGQAVEGRALQIPAKKLLELYSGLPEFWEERGDSAKARHSRFNLASAYHIVGRHEDAARELELLSGSDTSTGFEGSNLRQLRGEVALALGDLNEALDYFREALGNARRGAFRGASEWTWRAWHGIARVQHERGRFEAARQAYTQALRDRRNAAKLTPIQDGRMTYFSNRSRVVADAATLALEHARVEEAIRIWDQERAAILSALDTQSRRASLSPEDDRRLLRRISAFKVAREIYEDFRRSVREQTEATVQPAAREKAVRKLETARRELDRAFEDVFLLLDRRSTSSRSRKPETALHSLLRYDEALVYELPSRSGTNVAAWLESEGKVHRFDPELASDAFTAARERAPALRHLYVVAESDGELARSFSDPNVLQHVSVSSLPFAGILRQSQTSTSRSVLAVLDPEGDLSFARRELNVWPDSWPRTVLIGERAQRNTVLNGLRKGDVFHFAGHGMLMPGNPWASHIRVANGERITLEDVLATGRGPEIVILNGCETGSRTGAAEFFSFGLAEAFLMVGSRAVVATTRKVRDEDAAAFVRRFFGAFGEGPENSSAEAFRRAALAMTRKNPDLVGAFVLVGFR